MLKDSNIYNQYPECLGRFVHVVKEDVAAISPKNVAVYLLDKIYNPFDEFEQEEFMSLLLNARYRITHTVLHYRGTTNLVHICPSEVFRDAVRVNAYAMIVTHNHPTGIAEFSEDDLKMTKRLKEGSKLLGISLHDHMVIGRDCWKSMRESYEELFA